MGLEFRHKTKIDLILADFDPTFRRLCREAIERHENQNYCLLEVDTADDLAWAIRRSPNATMLLDPGPITFRRSDKTPEQKKLKNEPIGSISQVRNLGHKGPILVCTNDSSVNKAIAFIHAGAENVLAKPANASAIMDAISTTSDMLEKIAVNQTRFLNTNGSDFVGFVGRSNEMQAVYSQIESIAKSSAPAFITGESGTGKELCADAIHQLSSRSNRPLISLNCGAIPRDLMESEIFGHVKGAFTGATNDHPGAAELADGGTLFLDEICEMEPALQTKLLRFIQTGNIRRVGGTKDIQLDLRFVCATNKDPFAEMHAGNFREDLYYRLHVIPVHLSPLRERTEDILPIAQNYLDRCTKEENSSFSSFSDEAISLLKSYNWPGNVRQLQNVVRHLVVLNDGEIIDADMLGHTLNESHFSAPQPSRDRATENESIDQILPMSVQERRIIESAVCHCGGNIVEAANALAISPSTIYRKLQSWQNTNIPKNLNIY